MIDFSKIIDIFTSPDKVKLILAGIISTIILSVFGTVVGLFLGIFIAYGKNIKTKPTTPTIAKIGLNIVRWICQIYSVDLRGTPMMVQALIFKYGCAALGLSW